jgi:hypothetical protein
MPGELQDALQDMGAIAPPATCVMARALPMRNAYLPCD